ncbi:MAG: TRAP transporter substrate-binding protein [Betaproteobacteria bacterium]|nr:TRAP transporter substrate-binding protein [Betaproteobacteria bacterium]
MIIILRAGNAAIFAASLLAVGSVFAQTKPAAPAVNVLVGNATANDTQAAANDKFAELMTKYSGGRLKASAHHGQSLGNIPQMLSSLQAGSVHGMILPAGFLSTMVHEMSMLDMPFLLPGAPAKITAFAAQSKAAAKMMELAELKGIHIIGFHGIGPQSFLTKFPVNKLADLQGRKIRDIPSPSRNDAYKDWGAVPRMMDFGEVYTGLQQGTIDGVVNPPDVLYKMKMHEVTKFFTITEHFVFVSNVIVSKKWFDALPKDLQGAVTKAGKETIAFADVAYTKAQNDSLEALKKAVTVTSMPAAEIQKMKAAANKGVWQKMRNDPGKGPILKLLEEDVANFNKK